MMGTSFPARWGVTVSEAPLTVRGSAGPGQGGRRRLTSAASGPRPFPAPTAGKTYFFLPLPVFGLFAARRPSFFVPLLGRPPRTAMLTTPLTVDTRTLDG